MSAYSAFANSVNSTPQTQKIFGREKDQVFNNAGGAVFQLTPMQQFRRFLILGTAGGTYYASEQKLTKENAQNVVDIFNSYQGPEAVELLVKVSDEGLAPKLSPTIFALALAFASSNKATKKAAVHNFNVVIRTQSHLFEFISYARQFRGMGRLLREAIRNWYQTMPADKLAYQVTKYRQRSGYTTRDVLRLVKPKPVDEGHQSVYEFATRVEGRPWNEPLFPIIEGYEAAKASTTIRPELITNYKLTHEMVPTDWLNSVSVWEALLANMPLTAMIRNLGKMTNVGLIKPLSAYEHLIVKSLQDAMHIRRSRVHPFSILLALTTYKVGRGVKGSLNWTPSQRIVDALEDAFYLAFGNVESTGKRILLALDVSGSMGASIMNTHLSCREAAMALALLTARTEDQYYMMGFQNEFVPLDITAKDSLTSAVDKVRNLPFGSTNCALPFEWGMKNKIAFDACITITDNETYTGRPHPVQTFRRYRQKMGIDVKNIVVGMTASSFRIADHTEANMLDVVGFDSSAPQMISNFISGRI